MARARRPVFKQDQPLPETLASRINHLIQFSRGTMPIAMLVRDQAEAEAALKMLARRKGGGKIIVKVEKSR